MRISSAFEMIFSWSFPESASCLPILCIFEVFWVAKTEPFEFFMNDLNASEIAKPEFVIALTAHRFFGTIFVPYLIRREEQFFRVVRHVKPRDFKTESDYTFQPWEKELVEIIDRYSDERLMKKFSRSTVLKEFYSTLQPAGFQKNIIPFIEQCMYRAALILMVSPVRLLNKDAKYANLYDEDEIEVQPLFVKPFFYFNRTETGTKYRLEIFHIDKKIPLLNRQTRIVTNDPCVFVQNGKCTWPKSWMPNV